MYQRQSDVCGIQPCKTSLVPAIKQQIAGVGDFVPPSSPMMLMKSSARSFMSSSRASSTRRDGTAATSAGTPYLIWRRLTETWTLKQDQRLQGQEYVCWLFQSGDLVIKGRYALDSSFKLAGEVSQLRLSSLVHYVHLRLEDVLRVLCNVVWPVLRPPAKQSRQAV